VEERQKTMKPITPADWPGAVGVDKAVRLLAVCAPGKVEDRVRHATKALGRDVHFSRTFDDALRMASEHFYEVVIVAKTDNGMSACEFVSAIRRASHDSVVLVAFPGARYEQVVEVMVEGAYDFLPEGAGELQLRLMLGRAIEHARLRRKSSRLERALDARTESLRQRLQELVLLHDVIEDMSSVSDLDEVLGRTLDRILEAFGSTCGSFFVLEPETGDLVVRVAAGTGAEQCLGNRHRIGEGISGKVARDRHPVLVTNIEDDSRFREDAQGENGARGYRSPSFVAVPLVCHERLVGEMNIAEKGSGENFTPDDLRLLATLAGHVAGTINSALLAQELHRAQEQLNAAHPDKQDSDTENQP